MRRQVMLTSGLVLLTTMLMLAEHLPYIALHNGLLIPAYGLILVGLSQPNWLTRLLSAPLLVLLWRSQLRALPAQRCSHATCGLGSTGISGWFFRFALSP